MIKTITDWKLDVWGLTETNILWHNISRHQKWAERMDSIGINKSDFAYNRHEATGTLQFLPGGVGQVSTRDMAGRIIDHGKDGTGLGRWIWQKFQGRFGYELRIITFYRPCKGETQDVEASLTTYSQHRRFYNNDSIEPRKKCWTIWNNSYVPV